MNLDDMKEKAKLVLTEGAEAYYNAGAEDGTSMAEALACWDRDWRLRPRNLSMSQTWIWEQRCSATGLSCQ